MWQIAAQALLGGVLVVVFALLSEIVSPKRFGGLLSAAPAIALGTLVVTVLVTGAPKAAAAAHGMIAGAVGFTAYALTAALLLHRMHPLAGAAAGLVVWAGVAALAYPLVPA